MKKSKQIILINHLKFTNTPLSILIHNHLTSALGLQYFQYFGSKYLGF
jgi:hypothetical protein